MKKIWTAVIAVVCAGVFFYVGMVYGKNTSQSSGGNRGGNFAFSSSTRSGFGGGVGGRTGGGLVTGQIISTNANSMTVQLANGNSQVVFFSSSTDVEKPTQVPVSNLVNGAQVVVTGSQNSDGSVTAQMIQIRPAGAGGFFPNATSSRNFGTQSGSQ